MPQDAFTLKHLCREFSSMFLGGKINRIIQPSSDEVILTIYNNKKTEKLMISVNPSCPRMGILEREVETPLTAPNFCMLLRKHLLSATIIDFSLIGFDRIVKIELESSPEFSDSVIKTLYIELMGRYSNVILVENGKVLGGNRGINNFDNGVRPLIVGKEYLLPPVNNKKVPSDENLINIFDGVEKDKLADVVLQNVQGLANSTVNEIVSEYSDCNSLVSGDKFFCHLNNYIEQTEKRPCVIIEDGAVKDLLVCDYKLIKGERRYFNYLYQAEEFYFSSKEKHAKFTALKTRLVSVVNGYIKKSKKRLANILAKEKDAENLEQNKINGELILANIYKIKKGEKQVVIDNYYDNSKVTIVLDENLSPQRNAENYYKKYNKQKRALTHLIPQKEQAQNEYNYFASLLDEINLAEDLADLIAINSEMIEEGIIEEKTLRKSHKEKQRYYNEYLVDGCVIKAGRNNVENDRLTKSAKGDDLWLHAKDYHSSHVIIEKNGKGITDKVIVIGAEICAYYSKGRNAGKVEIAYTEKKNVKKPPKSKLGFCTYENFKSIIVEANKHIELIKSDEKG